MGSDPSLVPARRNQLGMRVNQGGARYWPVFALFPILVVGQAKATGWSSIAGLDATVLSVALLMGITTVTFLSHPRYPVRAMLPFFIFALVVLLGVAHSDLGEYQYLKTRDFFLLTGVVVACIPVLLRDIRDLRGLLFVWLFGGVVVASLVLVIGGAEDLYGRAGIGDSTLGPAYLSAAALVVGSAAMGERLVVPALAVPAMVVSGVALVAIGSRGPIIGAALGLLTWVLMRGAFRIRSVLVVLVVMAVVVVGVREASEAALDRLILEDPSRRMLWAEAWEASLDSPFLGMGWGDFATLSWVHVYPHNLLLETSVELGVLGLFALLGLLAAVFIRVWRTRTTPEVRVLAGVVVVLLIGQQFSSDLTNRMFWTAVIPCLLLPVFATGIGTQPGNARSGAPGPGRAAAHRHPNQASR